MKCQINLDIYNPEAPAFWPAAPLRRTSVFAASENLGAGRIHSARAGQIPRGAPRKIQRFCGAGKKKMRTLGTVQLPTEAFMAVLKLDE